MKIFSVYHLYMLLVFLLGLCIGKFFTHDNVIQNQQTAAIGFIKIGGTINPIAAEKILKKIFQFSEDHAIKSILLAIDSSGGDCGTTELLFREISLLSNIKPVVALVINRCCSGAYKIAIGAHWIIAPAAAIIGNIGTWYSIEWHKNIRIHNNYHQADVHHEIIAAGKFKVLNHPESLSLNDEERALVQESVNGNYKIFCLLVAQQRRLSLENISDWADGKIFNGAIALEKGLVDQVGGFSDAIAKLKELMQKKYSQVHDKLIFIE